LEKQNTLIKTLEEELQTIKTDKNEAAKTNESLREQLTSTETSLTKTKKSLFDTTNRYEELMEASNVSSVEVQELNDKLRDMASKRAS
jgi:chromosome segregation ATPase